VDFVGVKFYCPQCCCWRQVAHLDSGEDVWILSTDVICTVSILDNSVTNFILWRNCVDILQLICGCGWTVDMSADEERSQYSVLQAKGSDGGVSNI